MEALKSDLPYDEAMTQILFQTLDSLGAVKSREDTYQALELVRNEWWCTEKRIPNQGVLLLRDTDVYTKVSPRLVPNFVPRHDKPHQLEVKD